MAYRALITIQSLDLAGEVQNQCHATVRINDDWLNAEMFAEKLLGERTYPGAAAYADQADDECHYRGVDWDGLEDFRKTWADQEWVVTFKCLATNDDMEATITGLDSTGETIFFRRRTYGL